MGLQVATTKPTNGAPAPTPPVSGHAANATEDAQTNWASMPRAKRHSLLAQVSNALQGTRRTRTVEVFGKWYELASIDPLDNMWTYRFIDNVSILTFATGRQAPLIAASLRAIGSAPNLMVPVEALFQVPEEMDVVSRAKLLADPLAQRDWRRTEVLAWLTEPSVPPELITKLFATYEELATSRSTALEALSPLVSKSRTGESYSTSSDGPGDSSPTLPSET